MFAAVQGSLQSSVIADALSNSEQQIQQLVDRKREAEKNVRAAEEFVKAAGQGLLQAASQQLAISLQKTALVGLKKAYKDRDRIQDQLDAAEEERAWWKAEAKASYKRTSGRVTCVFHSYFTTQ